MASLNDLADKIKQFIQSASNVHLVPSEAIRALPTSQEIFSSLSPFSGGQAAAIQSRIAENRRPAPKAFTLGDLASIPRTVGEDIGNQISRGVGQTAMGLREAVGAPVPSYVKDYYKATVPFTNSPVSNLIAGPANIALGATRLTPHFVLQGAIGDATKQIDIKKYPEIKDTPIPDLVGNIVGLVGSAAFMNAVKPFKSGIKEVKVDKKPVQAEIVDKPVDSEILQTQTTKRVVGNQAPTVIDGKERSLVTRMKLSDKLPKDARAMLEGKYTPITNEETIATAKSAVLIDPKAAEIRALAPQNAFDQAMGAELFKKYMEAGDIERANRIINATSGTNEGQMIQILSQYDKTTPFGSQRFLQNAVKAFNKLHPNNELKVSDENIKTIYDQATKIQKMAEGAQKNIAQQELMNYMNELFPSDIADKIITVWKAGLLTSLRTTGRNLLGNTIHLGAETVKDAPAALADRLMSLSTGNRSMSFTTQGLGEGGVKGLKQAKDIIQTGYDPEQLAANFDIRHTTWGKNVVEQSLKKYSDFVFRTLAAEDKPFWQAAYARSLYDQAGAAAMNAGKQGDPSFIQEFVKNAPTAVKTLAMKDANVATFHDANVVSGLANAFKQWAGQKWYTKLPAEIVAPFTGVPSSIAAQTAAYSPLGLVKGIIDTGRVTLGQATALQRQAAQEVGRGAIGTAVYTLGAYLLSKGLISGQPKDTAEAKQWELEGRQPNSVFVDGKWRSINSIGPENLVLLAGAKLQEELSKGKDASIGKYALSMLKDQLNQTMLQGGQQILQAINEPDRYGERYAGNLAASFIPNIIKDVGKSGDTIARENNTGMDYSRNALPFLRNQSLPKRDVLGNEIKQEPTGISAFFDIFNSRTPISNEVVDELSRLNNAGFNATPSELKEKQTINGVASQLTPEQLNTLEEQTGIKTQSALKSLILSPQYQALGDQEKALVIDTVVKNVRKQVRGTVDLSGVMPDYGYEQSSDAPKGILDTVSVYGASIFKDPVSTFNAVISGNPIRKTRGDAVILERKQGLGSLDKGDTSTQVDHKIALALGGSNDKSNLQTISTVDNMVKGKVETYLASLLDEGKINRAEAQKRDLNWRNEIDNLPQREKTEALAILNSPNESVAKAVETKTVSDGESEKVMIINPETGSIKTIDKAWTPPVLHKTGNELLDKKVVSKYNNALTSRANDILALYNNGDITSSDAEIELQKLAALKYATAKKPKKARRMKITLASRKFSGASKIKGLKNSLIKSPPKAKISVAVKKGSLKIPTAAPKGKTVKLFRPIAKGVKKLV